MDQLAKIHGHRWKERLTISKVAKFEVIEWKLTKIWLRRVANFYRRLYDGGQVYAPHHTNVCKISRLCGAISSLFSDISLSNCVASRRLSTVLNDFFYLTIIAGSVDVQNLNCRVVLVSERQMLIQMKEIHLPSGVSQFVWLASRKVVNYIYDVIVLY